MGIAAGVSISNAKTVPHGTESWRRAAINSILCRANGETYDFEIVPNAGDTRIQVKSRGTS